MVVKVSDLRTGMGVLRLPTRRQVAGGRGGRSVSGDGRADGEVCFPADQVSNAELECGQQT